MKIIVFLILVLVHREVSAQVFYIATKLGDLGGGTSDAFGINDNRQVVGASKTASGQTHAFLWDGGTMTDLTPNETLRTTAFDINNRGQVVGQRGDGSDDQGNMQIAFLLENGISQSLFESRSAATSINDEGEYTVTRPGGDVAVNYRGINDLGDRIGEASGGGYKPLLNGTPIQTTLGFGIPYSINNRRSIVGFTYSDRNDPVTFPTLWTGGRDHILNSQPGEAFAVNEDDQVVGYSGGKAFVYKDGSFSFLDDLVAGDIKFTVARGINEWGDIIAQGNDGSAYFLQRTAVPEISSSLLAGALLLSGAIATKLRRR